MKVESICLRIAAGAIERPNTVHPIKWRAMLNSADDLIHLISVGLCDHLEYETDPPSEQL